MCSGSMTPVKLLASEKKLKMCVIKADRCFIAVVTIIIQGVVRQLKENQLFTVMKFVLNYSCNSARMLTLCEKILIVALQVCH